MEFGQLNLPKPELERFSSSNSIQTRLFIQYSELIKETDIGKKFLIDLASDSRVIKLDGHMISKGSSASRFSPNTLAMWFLWASNEFGTELASEYLNTYLNSDNIYVMQTLWILGVEVEESIQLSNGVCITPVSEMPDSNEKEHYLKFNDYVPEHPQVKPKAAITCLTKIAKSFIAGEDPSSSYSYERMNSFWESSKLLYETSLTLNAIKNTSCIPYCSTAYNLPQVPLGLFGGSGTGQHIHDVIGNRITKIDKNQAGEINAVLSSFLAMPDKEKARFSRVLSRLSQSKRREKIEDMILDLGIALEMALLDDNINNQQLSLSFRLRGSWLISTDENERLLIFKELGDIYKYRSQVAHSDVLCGNDAEKINAVREIYPKLVSIAERIVSKLICDARPDWSKLLLGIK